MKTKDFFDLKANEYDIKRTTGLLGRHVDKERAIVLKLLGIKKGEHILDAGCGAGHYSILMKNADAVPFGIDFSERMVAHLQSQGIEGRVADLENFNLNAHFDKILCAGALEFLKNQTAALLNFGKHLKSGGCLVLLYPKKSLGGYAYKLYHKTHSIEIKLFSHDEIKKMLENAGFKAVAMERANSVCNAIKAVKI